MFQKPTATGHLLSDDHVFLQTSHLYMRRSLIITFSVPTLQTFRRLVGKAFCLCERSKLLHRGEGRTDCPSCQERGWWLCLGALPFSLPQCLKSLLSDFSLSKSCRDPATSTLEAEGGLPLCQLPHRQPLIKQCITQGGALARQWGWHVCFVKAAWLGFAHLGAPGSPGFRIPDIFPFHSLWTLVF